MNFVKYVNRFGHELVLEQNLCAMFLSMKNVLFAEGIDIDMTDGWRGEDAQDEAKASGHSNAVFGQSPHNYGVAFDCAPVENGQFTWPNDQTLWNRIGEIGTGLGLTWGGSFHSIVDLPHFEISGWKGMNLTLYQQEPPLSAA